MYGCIQKNTPLYLKKNKRESRFRRYKGILDLEKKWRKI